MDCKSFEHTKKAFFVARGLLGVGGILGLSGLLGWTIFAGCAPGSNEAHNTDADPAVHDRDARPRETSRGAWLRSETNGGRRPAPVSGNDTPAAGGAADGAADGATGGVDAAVQWQKPDSGPQEPPHFTDGGTPPADAAPLDGEGENPTDQCTKTSDCAVQEYCAKAACADLYGQCLPRPFGCWDAEQPVCGCDGINYWNPCTAALHGINVRHLGSCNANEAFVCAPDASFGCPVAGAVCGTLLEDESDCVIPDLTAACWVLPQNCNGGANGWRACNAPLGACLSRGAALEDGGAFFADPACAP
jgi:hypothetical protein